MLLAKRRLAWATTCSSLDSDDCGSVAAELPMEVADKVCAMVSVECVFRHHCVCTYAALWCECSEETASIVRQLRPSHGSITIGRGLLRAALVSKK